MKDAFQSAGMISFLDLISCGLGAALLLFVIGAAATPVLPPLDDDRSVLIVSRREGGSHAEVGLQWRIPGGDWQSSVAELAQALSVPSSAQSGGEAILILRAPPSGRIEVRPYLRSFPAPGQDPAGLGPGCRVSIEAFGKGVAIPASPPPVPMVWPGRAGQVVEIQLDNPPVR